MNKPMNKPVNICEKSLNSFSTQVIHKVIHRFIHRKNIEKHRHSRSFLSFSLFTQPIIKNKNIKTIYFFSSSSVFSST